MGQWRAARTHAHKKKTTRRRGPTSTRATTADAPGPADAPHQGAREAAPRGDQGSVGEGPRSAPGGARREPPRATTSLVTRSSGVRKASSAKEDRERGGGGRGASMRGRGGRGGRPASGERRAASGVDDGVDVPGVRADGAGASGADERAGRDHGDAVDDGAARVDDARDGAARGEPRVDVDVANATPSASGAGAPSATDGGAAIGVAPAPALTLPGSAPKKSRRVKARPKLPVASVTAMKNVRRKGTTVGLAAVQAKRRARLGVTDEAVEVGKACRRKGRREAGCSYGGLGRLPVPSDAEHAAAGLAWPYTADAVLEITRRHFMKKGAGANENTLRTYKTYLHKFCAWAFRDWTADSAGLRHPYHLSAARLERFVEACFSPTSRPDAQELEGDAERSGYTDVHFGVSGLKNCMSACTVMWKSLREHDAHMKEEWRKESEGDDAERAAAARMKLDDDEDGWAFISRLDKNVVEVSKLGIWAQKKSESVATNRSLAAGGRPRGGFGNTAEILRPITTDENVVFTEWVRDSWATNASGFLTVQTVAAVTRVCEHFLARPGEVLSMKLADISVVDASTVSNGVIRAPYVLLTTHKHKASMATSKSETRTALRHCDVASCGIGALLEAIWANFALAGYPEIDLGARDDSHSRATHYPDEVDATALLRVGSRKMVRWHGRHIFPRDRVAAAGETNFLSAATHADAKDDMVSFDVRMIQSVLNKIREETYTEARVRALEEREEDATAAPRSSVDAHTMHRRATTGNRMLLRGASVRCVDDLAGWLDNKVSKQHYLHVPECQGLISAAGCNAAARAYYLEYERDTLEVSNHLRALLFPWVSQLQAAAKRFNISGWPEGLADAKIEGFLDFLEYGRRVLWQDWAISRALAERDSHATEDAGDAEWLFWNIPLFQEAGPDWEALCDEARRRVQDPACRIPKYVDDGSRESEERFVAYAQASHDLAKTTHAHVRQMGDDVRDLRAEFESRMKAVEDTVSAQLREFMAAVPAACQAAASAPAVSVEPAPASADSGVTYDELIRIGKGCTPGAFKNDVVDACNSWEKLQRLAEGVTDKKCREYMNGKRYGMRDFVCVLRRVAEDVEAKSDDNTTARRDAALRKLQAAARARHANGLFDMLNKFNAGLQAVRATEGTADTDTVAVIKYKAQFVVELAQMVQQPLPLESQT